MVAGGTTCWTLVVGGIPGKKRAVGVKGKYLFREPPKNFLRGSRELAFSQKKKNRRARILEAAGESGR